MTPDQVRKRLRETTFLKVEPKPTVDHLRWLGWNLIHVYGYTLEIAYALLAPLAEEAGHTENMDLPNVHAGQSDDSLKNGYLYYKDRQLVPVRKRKSRY